MMNNQEFRRYHSFPRTLREAGLENDPLREDISFHRYPSMSCSTGFACALVVAACLGVATVLMLMLAP